MKPIRIIEKFLDAPVRRMTVSDVQGEIRSQLKDELELRKVI